MRKSTAAVLAAWPTICDRCGDVVPRGGKFVVGRRHAHYCLACWEGERE